MTPPTPHKKPDFNIRGTCRLAAWRAFGSRRSSPRRAHPDPSNLRPSLRHVGRSRSLWTVYQDITQVQPRRIEVQSMPSLGGELFAARWAFTLRGQHGLWPADAGLA